MHVAIIAKAPVAGRAKTRLCPPCTLDEAAEVAAAALVDTIEGVDGVDAIDGGPPFRRVLLLDGAVPSLVPAHYDVAAQCVTGLAERLRNGFADLGPGVIIGMETPHVAPLLGDALAALGRDVDVIGPAQDGGYWMIGLGPTSMNRLDAIFDGVPMSTGTTGSVQLQRLQAGGRPVEILAIARDPDTYDDLRAVAGSGRAGRLPAVAATIVARHS
ncbi:DUF2064 domain-containing protein [soil metagenome]